MTATTDNAKTVILRNKRQEGSLEVLVPRRNGSAQLQSRNQGRIAADVPPELMTLPGIDPQDRACADAIDVALADRRYEAAVEIALDRLKSQGNGQGAMNSVLIRLLGEYRELLRRLPPFVAIERLQVHFDDRVAQNFGILLALIRRQDAQIADLQSIINDLM